MSPGASKLEREATPTQVHSSVWISSSSAICAATEVVCVRCSASADGCRVMIATGQNSGLAAMRSSGTVKLGGQM